ncbi:glycosyltransferase family 2 protein [Priestia aryabhattai]|uniref:glycosyltransferase family 2 protein n=1 Tax=Priestia aryabhattai TaxID=412384 RepID=UPI00203C79E9|nr:glycosyltransferase [Priestia aryabhattai]MCM3253617.1 glycosyltransferase [Priestia aryabhattai]
MCRVSIIVPVYNVEKYVGKCLHSLVNQTLKDIEIIIVNDGSTDNSQVIIDDYVKNYGNKLVSLNKKNGGLSDARNFGLKHAKGEYVGFIDSDDWVELNMYEKLYNHCQETNADIIISDFIFEPDNSIIHANLKNGVEINLKSNPELLLIEPSVCNKLFKRSLFYENNIEFPYGLFHEDRLAISKLYYHAEKIYYVKEAFYHYLKHRENSITTSVNMKKYNDIIILLNEVDQFFIEKDISPYIRQSLDTLFLNLYIAFCTRAISEIPDKKKRNVFLDDFGKFIESKVNQPLGVDKYKEKKILKILLILLMNRKYTLINILIKVRKLIRG